MTDDTLNDLVRGYRMFRRDHYAAEAARYRSLAEHGQTPRTMVIACSDSRVDPARIFDARPGELFVVRNVANLVPPCEEHGDYHGTSAALEFAVRFLHVERILVLGHARCGGVRAFLDGAQQAATPRASFIEKWISLLAAAHAAAARRGLPAGPEERQRCMEHAGIVQSLANLATFDFVRSAIDDGRLSLFGGYFDISTGELELLDRKTERFRAVAGRPEPSA